MKLDVSVVGPQFRSYGPTDIDHSYRDLTVEMRLRPDSLAGEEFDYFLTRSTSKYSSGWSEPYCYIEASVFGRAARLEELERKARMLKRLFAYEKGLPVKPETLAQWVATIATLHKLAMGALYVYKDSHTRPTVVDQSVTVAFICHTVQELDQTLVPTEAAA